jgi:hypothetical protein
MLRWELARVWAHPGPERQRNEMEELGRRDSWYGVLHPGTTHSRKRALQIAEAVFLAVFHRGGPDCRRRVRDCVWSQSWSGTREASRQAASLGG